MTDTDDPTMSDYGVNDLYLKVLRAANFPHAADEIAALRAEVKRLQALVARMTHADAKAATVPIDAAFAVSPTPTEPT